MKIIPLCLLLISSAIFANSGTGLLLNTDGEDIDVKSTIGAQKELKFDDNFQIQLFGSWKASGMLPHAINDWVLSVLNNDYEKSLKSFKNIRKKSPSKFLKVADATELYLLYKNNLNQTFLDKWLTSVSGSNFLKTEIGLALDYVVSKKIGSWIIKNGFQFTHKQLMSLERIENLESRINYSLQAWNAMRTGKNALKWVRKISEANPIKVKLINTILLSFAKKGKLKASAKLIKEVFEPVVTKSDDVDEISFYYLTLARLLYQAKAYPAAKEYYYSIPKDSKYFLNAREEVLWALIQMDDLGAVKGELKSLKLDLFEDRFAPEVYLVSAMANIKTCQFENVKNNFDLFLSRNKSWAKRINKNITSAKPEMVKNDFYLENTNKALKQISFEEKYLRALKDKAWKREIASLDMMRTQAQKNQVKELKRRWKNKEKILDQAIYKMRFVKVEFISRMRELSMRLANKYDDAVSTYKAAPKNSNQIDFPYDGLIWGDEVFNFSAQVENLCLRGLKK